MLWYYCSRLCILNREIESIGLEELRTLQHQDRSEDARRIQLYRHRFFFPNKGLMVFPSSQT